MVLKSKLGIILSKIFLGYEILEILITTDAQHSTYPSCNLLQRIARILSYPYKTAKSQIKYKNESRKNEIMDTVADIRKAKEKLGWEPSVNIDAGLKNMLGEWYKAHG